MAGKRNIIESADVTRQTYFSHETASFEDKGNRTMRPLFPFVISGGKNTERYYFRHIADTTSYKFNVIPEYFGMESGYTEIFPIRIRKILKDNPDAQIFCVFDWDTVRGHTKKLEKNQAFVNQFKSEIDSETVVVCPSMPSIEYWFLLHFENYTDLIPRCGRKIQTLLSPYMTPYFPDSKKKLLNLLKSEEYINKSEWVEKLCADGKLDAAIKRAEDNINAANNAGELDNQSYSYVYKVFKNVK